MEVTLAKGKEKHTVSIDDSRAMGCLLPEPSFEVPEALEEIVRALSNPIGCPRLRESVRPGMRVVIVTSDITRPCPSRIMLPPVLSELESAGIRKSDISIVFALGSHRKHTAEEIITLVGADIAAEYACIDSDADDVILIGETSRETPIEIFRPVVDADFRICLGNIEYHYFAGYSGGAKAIFPGVSTPRSIQANHRMMIEEGASTGRIVGNPVRADLEELAQFLSIDFILNVVLGSKKEILHCSAGHYIEAHREGCRFLDKLYKFELKEYADIVLVSAGGYPKDINMYQAQKALDNARFAVREGGAIILVASCPETYGSATFERWIRNAESPAQIIRDIAKNFELGGHKAAAIALALERATVFSVTDMPDEVDESLFFKPMPSVEAALNAATVLCGEGSRILIMPVGGSTLPTII